MINLFISLLIYTIGLITQAASSDQNSYSQNLQKSVGTTEKTEYVLSKSDGYSLNRMIADTYVYEGYVNKIIAKEFYLDYCSLNPIVMNFTENSIVTGI